MDIDEVSPNELFRQYEADAESGIKAAEILEKDDSARSLAWKKFVESCFEDKYSTRFRRQSYLIEF
ncbi:8688_t:CDS:2 [Cetraspora pellucida]|uniref:8688_t:CDS:1 n=1 Tax=Cetraspora pellucida TaxID=1433469 RepID=A0ACA9KQI1_9GLOM|nr:8688_t:CDS:2 [Cetraspora pellucida]